MTRVVVRLPIGTEYTATTAGWEGPDPVWVRLLARRFPVTRHYLGDAACRAAHAAAEGLGGTVVSVDRPDPSAQPDPPGTVY